jgi:signal transduction histidine kinase
MNWPTAVRLLTKPELDRFLDETISRLRWATVAALLLISLAQPSADATRVREWVLTLLFAGYNAVTDVVRRRARRAFAWIAVVDLPAVALVYFLASQLGGPAFALLVLVAAQTASFMTLTGNLLYLGALGLIVVVVEPALPGWAATIDNMRGMSTRLLILAVVGIGMGTMTRRLATEQTAGQIALGEADRLGEVDQLRAEFVASVSHELRTPLTAARAGLGLLEGSAGDRLEDAERELMANTRRNVERLDALIANLLTANQLGAGMLTLDRATIDLRPVVADAMAAVHPLIQTKGQLLELALGEPLPVRGDPGRLEQVVLNVLANAHRHTPAGTRIVVSGQAAGDQVLLSVQDDGPGILATELGRIFDRFYRLGGAGGSGLGLAVARGIVDLHGGTIWAESRPGEGATFQIILPRAASGAEG